MSFTVKFSSLPVGAAFSIGARSYEKIHNSPKGAGRAILHGAAFGKLLVVVPQSRNVTPAPAPVALAIAGV